MVKPGCVAVKRRVYGATAIAHGIVEASDSPEAKLRKTIFTDVFVYRDHRWQGRECAGK
jgi:hypothetical protein